MSKNIVILFLLLHASFSYGSVILESDYKCKVLESKENFYEFEISNILKDRKIKFSRVEVNFLKPTTADPKTSFFVQDFRFSIFCSPGNKCFSEEVDLQPGEAVRVTWDGLSDFNDLATSGKYKLDLSSACPGYDIDVCSKPLWGDCDFVVQ